MPATIRWRAARLALGTACALGLARFAYGLLVPAMSERLRWTMAEAGALTTANSAGYLLGALLATAVIGRAGLTPAFRTGMLVTVASLAATAMTGAYPALLLARAVAGLGGAWVFISGAALAARLARIAGTVRPMTVYFGGAGVGVAASGGVVPLLLDGHPERWPTVWWLLALAGAGAAVGSWMAAEAPPPVPEAARGSRPPSAPLWRVGAAYLLFGAGYLGYLTFLSSYLTAHHAGVAVVCLAWILIGLSAVVAPLPWHRLIAAGGGTRALRLLLGVLAVAAALPLLGSSAPAVVASGLLFGSAFMMVPAAVTAIASHTTAADSSRTLARLTVVFAIGQSLGPWLAGALSDRAGVDAVLAFTALSCGSAALLAGPASDGNPFGLARSPGD
ncbi:YbfB/YjiJ family MFS transporter [Micromonospora chersina]|uniref:YbfB/YjiJ family MFS transporter n=1 Tax=Micromonospora chersina TaxID=47854 RepID=UPI003723B4FB